MYNVTDDPTGMSAGAWINPADNVKPKEEQKKEEPKKEEVKPVEPQQEEKKDLVSNREGSTIRRPVARTKIGRNDPCPCGSGKKYKDCCANK